MNEYLNITRKQKQKKKKLQKKIKMTVTKMIVRTLGTIQNKLHQKKL